MSTIVYSDLTEDPDDNGDFAAIAGKNSSSKPRSALDKLNELVGLEKVKTEIKKIKVSVTKDNCGCPNRIIGFRPV